MKKILFTILAITFVSSLCFAAEPSTTPAYKAPAHPLTVKTLQGKVESVILGNPAKNIRSEITVVNEKGEKVVFVVSSKAEIFSKDGKAVSLDKAAKGDKVVIEYSTTSTGTHKAKSIKLAE